MHENLELNEPVTELDNLQKHFANIIQVTTRNFVQIVQSFLFKETI